MPSHFLFLSSVVSAVVVMVLVMAVAVVVVVVAGGLGVGGGGRGEKACPCSKTPASPIESPKHHRMNCTEAHALNPRPGRIKGTEAYMFTNTRSLTSRGRHNHGADEDRRF